MSIYERIKVNWTPKELDLYLQTRYSYSLWHFSFNLQWYLFLLRFGGRDLKRKRDSGKNWVKYWKLRIKELENLKSYNKNKIGEFLRKYTYHHPLFERDSDILQSKLNEEKIEKDFELNSYFDSINKIIKEIEKEIITIKEIPEKTLNLIAYVWSHFIKDEEKTCILDVVGLLQWFDKKFAHPRGERIFLEGIEKLNRKNLAIQFYRYRKGNKLKTIVNQQKRGFEYGIGHLFLSFNYNGVSIGSLPYALKHGNKNPTLLKFPNGEELKWKDYLENRKKAQIEI